MWSNILLNEWRNELINNICFWSCINWKDSDVGKLYNVDELHGWIFLRLGQFEDENSFDRVNGKLYNVDELHGWIFLSMIVKGLDNLTLNCDGEN